MEAKGSLVNCWSKPSTCKAGRPRPPTWQAAWRGWQIRWQQIRWQQQEEDKAQAAAALVSAELLPAV